MTQDLYELARKFDTEEYAAISAKEWQELIPYFGYNIATLTKRLAASLKPPPPIKCDSCKDVIKVYVEIETKYGDKRMCKSCYRFWIAQGYINE